MSTKDYIFLIKKSLFHKKINILKVFLLVLSMSLLILSCSFSKTFMNFLDNSVNGNVSYKVLLVDKLNVNKKEIESIKGVSFVISNAEYSAYVKTNNNEKILLYGVPQNYIEVISGKSMNNYELTDNILICPSHFYLGEEPEEINDEFFNYLYDGINYLNHKLILNDGVSFKVIGIYDEEKYTYGEYNVCFTTFENVKKINSQLYEDCENCLNEDDTSLYVIVDSYENKKAVSNTLKQLNYEVRDMVTINTDSVSLITYIFLGISSIIFLITFVIVLITNIKFSQYNEKNNLIYKALGYEDKILLKINYIESILISIISFILTIIFVVISYSILHKTYINDIRTGFSIQISGFSIILSLIICIILSLLSTYFTIKNNKKTIIKGLEDNEL